ncbi:Reverse transcriptase domain-containing protein, partial [Aphis craccivora]
MFDPETGVPEFQRSVPEFTADELRLAARRLSLGKAPGPSEVPNKILRALVNTQSQAVLETMNDCLAALTFPPRWKRARLVLIKKGADKPPDAPSSYRPICILDKHLDEHGGRRRAPNQFGFRQGISTETAVNCVLNLAAQAAATPRKKSLCVLVTLDVKNAFNSLRWPVIDKALRHVQTPEYLVDMLRSWLSDRTLLTGAERTSRPVTCGVPQGSVLGPALWNVAYDSLMRMDVPPGVQLIGFADDLAVVGTAATGQLLEDLVNPVLLSIDDWMPRHGLELAHQKTEAVILSRRRAFVPPRLSIGGHPITLYGKIRYLGVILDKNLTFAPHVDTVAKKASRTAAALARLMPNIGGPTEWKRKLLGTVVNSQLLYAAPAWIEKATVAARTRANLIRPQRAAALRTIRAYRTVSDEAALVLASTVPADLLGLERKRILSRLNTGIAAGVPRPSKASVKTEERSRTIEAWQQRWESTSKVFWTRRCISSVGRWLGRTVPLVPLTYHMSQALSGHGCFQAYLFKRARATSPTCLQCLTEEDTAEQTLLECPYWSAFRAPLATQLGHSPSAVDIGDIVCGPPFDQLPADPDEKWAYYGTRRTSSGSFIGWSRASFRPKSRKREPASPRSQTLIGSPNPQGRLPGVLATICLLPGDSRGSPPMHNENAASVICGNHALVTYQLKIGLVSVEHDYVDLGDPPIHKIECIKSITVKNEEKIYHNE